MNIQVKFSIAKGSGDILVLQVPADNATLRGVIASASSMVGTIDPSKFVFQRDDGVPLVMESAVRAGDFIIASPAKTTGN